MKRANPRVVVLSGCALGITATCMADSGKLLATPGVSQVEGSAGGGIVPWAQLAGYASDEQWSLGGFCSRASVDTEAGIAHTTQNQILARLAPLRGEVIKI